MCMSDNLCRFDTSTASWTQLKLAGFFGNLDWVFGPCVFLSYHLTWFQRKCSPDGRRKGEGLICGVGEQLMPVWELRMFDGAQFLLGWTNDPWRMFPRVVAAAIEVPDDGEAAREEQKCGNNYNPYKTSLFLLRCIEEFLRASKPLLEPPNSSYENLS